MDSGLMSKLVSRENFQAIRQELRQKGQKVVHCHGVFDLLHPGHIAHLEEAKSIGDVLVVSITSVPYVNKGPGRPYFNDDLRMKSLSALAVVDYVLLSETPAAFEIIEIVQPDFYVKGNEYEQHEDDVTQNIDKEVEQVRAHGGDVYYTDGITFSSTSILNNNFPVFSPNVKEYMKDFATKYPFNEFKTMVEDLSKLKVMVVGDIIIDEYVFCLVRGLMSKDRAFSAQYLSEERYLGGSLAVARHLSSFVDNVTVCGLVGQEAHLHSQMLNDLSKDMLLDLQFDPHYRTVVKRRYIEKRGKREEYDKVFSLNFLMDGEQNPRIDREAFYKKLTNNVGNYDIVIITDYGHGLLDQKAMDILQEKAKFLALNCQTNSSNYGTNLITKYQRADAFALDQREISLAFSTNSLDYPQLLAKLRQHLGSGMGWLTLGSDGALAMDREENYVQQPALTLTVQDTVGAGDAFYALSSLCAKAGYPTEIGTFSGNIAGAIAANVLGNREAIRRGDFLKFATTMLKF